MNRVVPPALGLLLALALAPPVRGDEPKRTPQVKVPDEEGALDAAPAPGSKARPGSAPVTRPPSERDGAGAGAPAAPSRAWHDGARPPAEEVPPAAVVRAAKRGEEGKARQRSGVPEPDGTKAIEILWHAPGS